MQLKNLTKGISAQGGKFAWDFGDGQTSTAANPTHIYLASGDYTVILKAGRLADTSTFRAKVRVERNWWKQTDPAIEPIKKYAEEVAQYDFPALDARNLMVAVSLFEHESASAPLVAAATALLKHPDLKEGDAPRLGLLKSEHLRKLGKAQEAVAALRELEARVKRPATKAQFAVEAGEVLLKDLHRWDEAEQEYQRALKTYATAGADLILRRAHVGLGDIWRHRGDGEKARAAYAGAAAIQVHSLPPNEAAVRIGTLARYVEDYTRQRQWEWVTKFLEDWAWEFPADKFKGNWSYLKAVALAAQNKKAAALEEAMDVLGANPQSPYAVRLLMLAAECQVALGDKEKARLLLQTAADDYPEDPDQAKARTRLMALGGPLPTDNKPKKP
jgi:tetratricopeptide (TPR) repeat protein